MNNNDNNSNPDKTEEGIPAVLPRDSSVLLLGKRKYQKKPAISDWKN